MAAAASIFHAGVRVFIVNNSEELTFRDFKKAEEASYKLKAPIQLLDKQTNIEHSSLKISFSSLCTLHTVISKLDP